MRWMRPVGAFPFVISFRAFAGLTRNPIGKLRPLFSLSAPKQRAEGKGKERSMKKLLMLGVALACAALVTGCGNPHEKMVRKLYAAIQSGDRERLDQFAEKNFAPGLSDQLKWDKSMKDVKRAFGKVAGSKNPVTVEAVKSVEREGFKGSVVVAKCDGSTLYFVVGAEKGNDDRIRLITDSNMWGGQPEKTPETSKPESAPAKAASDEKRTASSSDMSTAAPPADAKPLTPEQKVSCLMSQLKKVLGNSMTVSAALASIQEKVDQVQGDYKTKCVLMEMMGLQNKIQGGVVPDLPDPNGKGALEKYLKARELDAVGTIMCMYHVLSDEEQKSVADEVRKLMK